MFLNHLFILSLCICKCFGIRCFTCFLWTCDTHFQCQPYMLPIKTGVTVANNAILFSSCNRKCRVVLAPSIPLLPCCCAMFTLSTVGAVLYDICSSGRSIWWKKINEYKLSICTALWGCEIETQDTVLVGYLQTFAENIYISHSICHILFSIPAFISDEKLVFRKSTEVCERKRI